MALTNTTTTAGLLGRTIGDAVIAFNHVNVMLQQQHKQQLQLLLLLQQQQELQL